MLTELSKVKASPLLLTDFNYYFNKAINQYVNKRYAQVDLNQLMFDDLRVLKASTILDVDMVTSKEGLYSGISSYGQGYAQIFGGTYQVVLPTDYFHMLNCICIYKLSKDWKCYDSGNYVQFAAKPLTSDAWSTILNDYYQRPTPERPYYYIINTNQYDLVPTNPVNITEATSGDWIVSGTNTIASSLEEETSSETTEVVTYSITSTIVLTINGNSVTPSNVTVVSVTGGYERSDSGNTSSTMTFLGTTDPEVANPVVVVLVTYTDEDNNKYTFSVSINLNDTAWETTLEGSTPGTDINGHYNVKVIQDDDGYTTGEGGFSNFSRKIKLNTGDTIDAVDREAAYRYGNRSQVICQIRYGYDNSVFRLDKVLVDYIKVPQYIRLTLEQVNLTEDTSLMMEFPDYVCQEIINELTMLVMERDLDPRLTSNVLVSQSVDNPAVQQQAQLAALRAAAAQRQG